MKLELFLAADYANITSDGKLNVMGIFNEIYAQSFPAKHPAMHLVINMLPEQGEYGASRDLFVKLLDADGNQLIELSGQIRIPGPSGGKSSKLNIIFVLNDLVLPKPGIYQFVVLVDKDYKGDLPIYVNQKENRPNTQAESQ